jgi:hypothetical protein
MLFLARCCLHIVDTLLRMFTDVSSSDLHNWCILESCLASVSSMLLHFATTRSSAPRGSTTGSTGGDTGASKIGQEQQKSTSGSGERGQEPAEGNDSEGKGCYEELRGRLAPLVAALETSAVLWLK